VKRACFERVLMTSPDRLARRFVHQILLIEEWERSGCQVEFLERPMSQDPHDQLLLQIRGAVAEYERTLIAERMRRGRQQKYRAGKLLPWSRVPYGYRVNPDRPRDPTGVRLDESAAAQVREMFSYYLGESHSLAGLATHLYTLGVQPPCGHERWSLMTLRGILTNPVYTGIVYAGRTRNVPKRRRLSALKPIGPRCSNQPTSPSEWIRVGQIAAVISQEVFDLVQRKLAYNQQFASRNNTVHTYLLRALVSCGVCRAACYARSQQQHRYYCCRRKQGGGKATTSERCASRFIPAEQLEDLVWQDVCRVLRHPEMIALAFQRAQ